MSATSRLGWTLLAAGPNALWSLATGARRRALVLAYHRCLGGAETFVAPDQGYVTAAQLERQLRFVLKRRRPLLFGELATRADDGPYVAVTFDDGYRDVFDVARPILARLGVPATLFVASDAVSGRAWLWWDRLYRVLARGVGQEFELAGRVWRLEDDRAVGRAYRALLAELKRSEARDQTIATVERRLGDAGVAPGNLYLGWPEVRELKRDGWEIGAHGQNHQILTALPARDARADVAAGADDIACYVGERPRVFAYPNGRPGDFDAATAEFLRAEGFVAAATMVGGFARADRDPFRVRRLVPKGWDAAGVFALQTSGLYYKLKGS